MKSLPVILLIIISALIAAFSQIFLKKSAEEKHGSFLKEYINPYVLLSYLGYALVLAINTLLFTKIDYRYGVISNALAIAFVMLLSAKILKESVSAKKIAGTILIISGVLCFSLF